MRAARIHRFGPPDVIQFDDFAASFSRPGLGAGAGAVGTVLSLDGVKKAHEMPGGAPHAAGKIVLEVWDPS